MKKIEQSKIIKLINKNECWISLDTVRYFVSSIVVIECETIFENSFGRYLHFKKGLIFQTMTKKSTLEIPWSLTFLQLGILSIAKLVHQIPLMESLKKSGLLSIRL